MILKVYEEGEVIIGGRIGLTYVCKDLNNEIENYATKNIWLYM